jgi:hypothetical protein
MSIDWILPELLPVFKVSSAINVLKNGENVKKMAQKDTKVGENFVSALDEGSYFC